MEIMKKRGARRPRSKRADKTKGREPAPEGEAFMPLQIFAEGGFMVRLPCSLLWRRDHPRLETRLGVPILNLAKAGDEVRYMLGVEERIILTEQLTNGCPAGGPWDVSCSPAAEMMSSIIRWRCGSGIGIQLCLDRSHQQTTLPNRWHWCTGYEDLIELRDKDRP